MSKIYITGDTHIPIDIHKLSVQCFPDQVSFTHDDYVIISGDFGGVWDNSKEELFWRKWLSEKKFTTLFVDGNHENFPLLYTFPEKDMFGDKVREITPNVYYLQRGRVYEIAGKTFFTMGGASSHDKECRVEGKSWWREEIPNENEFSTALDNLDKAGWNVDYIITHCASNIIQNKLASWYEHDTLTGFFDVVEQDCKFKHWYFGHYHTDIKLDDKHTALYNDILPLFEKIKELDFDEER